MVDYEFSIKDMSIDNIYTRTQIIRKIHNESFFFGSMDELLKKIKKLDGENMSIQARHLSNRAIRLCDMIVRSFKKMMS